jgi:hypothetical protein
MVAQLQLTS